MGEMLDSGLYGKNPEGLPGRIGGLSNEKVRPLQAMARKTVRKK
jgi:hypothetical protein